MDSLELFFGKKRRVRKHKKSPGRKPKRGHGVKKLLKSQAYVVVRGRKRKLHRGANGGLYYRTKSGRTYVPTSVLRRKDHRLAKKALRKRRIRRKGRKLKMTKKAIAARKAYRKRMSRRSHFGFF